MKTVKLGNTGIHVPAIVAGCMRFSDMSDSRMNHFIHTALEQGANFFDHADIYGGGMSEEVFGRAWSTDATLRREDMILQSKCGIDTKSAVLN